MTRSAKLGAILVAGVTVLVLLMPLGNSCLLHFGPETPIQLTEPGENPYGMVACDNFRPAVPGWAVALVYAFILCGVGALAGRVVSGTKVALGGAMGGLAVLLAFGAGKVIFPWFEAYWMRASDLWIVVPLACALGALGGWLNSCAHRWASVAGHGGPAKE